MAAAIGRELTAVKKVAVTTASWVNETETGASSSSHCLKFASAAGPQSAF